MTNAYHSLPELRSGYALEDFVIVVNNTAYALSSFGFYLLAHSETGVAPLQQRVEEFSLRTGAQYDGYRVQERVVLLTGRFYGTNPVRIDEEMSRLAQLIVDKGIILRSITNERQLSCRYADGLTGNNAARNGQEVVLRFVAHDPWWQGLTAVTPVPLTNGTNTVTYNGTAHGLSIITLISAANGQVVSSVACTTNSGIISFTGLTLDNGDTLTIDLSDRTAATITKNTTSVWSSVDDDSTIIRMLLLPGENIITLTVGASITGTISWTERSWSLDR